MKENFFADMVIIGGIVLIAYGVMLKFGFRLPGDIVIRRENFTMYFPIASMIFLSMVISLIIRFLNK